MRYNAIIFDLLGTLVDQRSSLDDLHVQLAELLGLDVKSFSNVWLDFEFSNKRCVGHYPDLRAEFLEAISRLEEKVDAERIDRAVQCHLEFISEVLVPRSGVLEVLGRLKEEGYLLGLISDAARDVPVIWEETLLAPCFDTALISCSCGMRKPDPRFYQLACERLGVVPERCLFIGDGGSPELTGARKVGMDAMLICVPYERDIIMQREEAQKWDGPVIEQIEGVLEYLGLSQARSELV